MTSTGPPAPPPAQQSSTSKPMSKETIRVAVAGAAGRMGQAVCAAVQGAPDMELVARADPQLDTSLEQALRAAPDVVVDFTQPDTAIENALACLSAGAHVVIGTTGFDVAQLAERAGAVSRDPIGDAGQERDEQGATAAQAGPAGRGPNIFVAPNFAIGAVLMMRFAAEAAPYMAKAEIVELHHDRKLDAPSGTAARTARLMAEASGGPEPPIHSVRLPGVVANQEVILGDVGQTLTIRHDTTGRESFMPGVLMAIRRVAELDRSLTVGLEHLL